MTSSPKTKFPRALAIAACKEILAVFEPACERVIVAGSLRRRKEQVGDIEILYISKTRTERDGLFDTRTVIEAEGALTILLANGIIEKRTNSIGSEVWGKENKLARHCRSGIPVDFFATTKVHWFNYLVCRTGPKESNIAIAEAARRKRWKWHPYKGFTTQHGDAVLCTSEHEVFSCVGLPYKEPWER